MHHYFYKRLHYGSPRWAKLPSMTTQRGDCGLPCYPPNGSLIAVGGRNRGYNWRRNWGELNAFTFSVEVLRSGNCNHWQRLESIPFSSGHPGVEYFRERVFVLVSSAGRAGPVSLMMSSPPGTDIIEQWIILSPSGPRVTAPTLLTACNDQPFSISKSVGRTPSSVRNNSYTRNLS